jgi:hypothetical protein
MLYAPDEIWRPSLRFPRYHASTLGRIQNAETGHILRPYRMRNGYLQVNLCGNTVTAHTIVLEAFSGPRPKGYQASHLNGDRADNRAENLVWETPPRTIVGRHCTERSRPEIGTRAAARRTASGATSSRPRIPIAPGGRGIAGRAHGCACELFDRCRPIGSGMWSVRVYGVRPRPQSGARLRPLGAEWRNRKPGERRRGARVVDFGADLSSR